MDDSASSDASSDGGFNASGLPMPPALFRLRRFALSSKSVIEGFFSSTGEVGAGVGDGEGGCSGSRSGENEMSDMISSGDERVPVRSEMEMRMSAKPDSAVVGAEGAVGREGGEGGETTGVETPYCLPHRHSLG